MSTGPPVDLGPGSRACHGRAKRGRWHAAAVGSTPAVARRSRAPLSQIVAFQNGTAPNQSLPTNQHAQDSQHHLPYRLDDLGDDGAAEVRKIDDRGEVAQDLAVGNLADARDVAPAAP